MDKIIQRPWSVQIELTEGCNRLCKFCGLNATRKKIGNYKFMKLDFATKIALDIKLLCPNARIEFAMHGEPMINPETDNIIKRFRNILPKTQLQMTTNGSILVDNADQNIEELFESGLDILMIDLYKGKVSTKLRNELREMQVHDDTDFDIVDFYDDWAPKGMSPWTNYRRKVTRTVVSMDDLEKRNGERANRKITNQGGNNPMLPIPDKPLPKTCTIPFREISICANGDVCICCNDYSHQYICGNVNSKELSSIWYGNRFRAARRYLSNKKRLFTPCGYCDLNSGSRSGLLPKYPEPNENDIKRLRKIDAKSNFSLLREKKLWL